MRGGVEPPFFLILKEVIWLPDLNWRMGFMVKGMEIQSEFENATAD